MGLLFQLLIGFLISLNGYRIWMKRRIRLIHGSGITKVKEEDIPAYSRAVGISLIIVGLGITFAGIVAYFGYVSEGYITLGLLFISALVLFIRAQKKYNI